jgi:hypothetical protein
MSSFLNPVHDLPDLEFPPCLTVRKLLQLFIAAERHMNGLTEQQVKAALDGDEDLERFDVLIHDADEQRRNAKYVYLNHVDEHSCLPRVDGIIE